MASLETKDILADWISIQIDCHPTIPLLMVSGSQGIGKSTALKYIDQKFDGQIAILGIDEFYLTKAEREQLGAEVHDLFRVRGPAGTHDLNLLSDTIDALLSAGPDDSVEIPVFDKRIDDRLPKDQWHTFSGIPKAIVLEGWCIGAQADSSSPADAPLNTIEQRDVVGTWRAYQEEHLAGAYADLWDRADAFFHLSAPSFDQVLAWRTQQEETTLGLAPGKLPQERKDWVANFIQHYERMTKRMLSGGRRGGYTLTVKPDRSPKEVHLPTIPLIVFSDLDGTLLDHSSYSFDPAREALAALKESGAILVLASSKTATEISELRTQMGFEHCPAIVENGAGILEPGTFINTGSNETYGNLIDALNQLPAELRQQYTGFSDLSTEQVAELTGLTEEAAARAKQRGFSEPGTWHGSDEDLQHFLAHLAESGISARSGGRFLTLSHGKTKADQMFALASRFAPAPIAALGDAPNDIEMICAANFGVIINNTHGNGIPHLRGEATGTIVRTEHEGPTGWNRAILDILTKLDARKTNQGGLSIG